MHNGDVHNYTSEQHDKKGEMKFVPQRKQPVIGCKFRNTAHVVEVLAHMITDSTFELLAMLRNFLRLLRLKI